jgi:hypothetical protein|tara:strand:+ start:17786 stop:18010 length:225 start_codon:yes stop_codon:yes gene_type:complete
MGLLDLLPTSNLGLDGATPVRIPSANPASTLHYQSSITDVPNIDQSPSALDLNGIKPTISPSGQQLPYLDHLPR